MSLTVGLFLAPWRQLLLRVAAGAQATAGFLCAYVHGIWTSLPTNSLFFVAHLAILFLLHSDSGMRAFDVVFFFVRSFLASWSGHGGGFRSLFFFAFVFWCLSLVLFVSLCVPGHAFTIPRSYVLLCPIRTDSVSFLCSDSLRATRLLCFPTIGKMARGRKIMSLSVFCFFFFFF